MIKLNKPKIIDLIPDFKMKFIIKLRDLPSPATLKFDF